MKNRGSIMSEAEVLAMGYAAVGDMDTAFAALERAYQARSAGLIYLHLDPAMNPCGRIRGMPSWCGGLGCGSLRLSNARSWRDQNAFQGDHVLSPLPDFENVLQQREQRRLSTCRDGASKLPLRLPIVSILVSPAA